MGAKIAVTIGIVSRGNEPFLGECLRAVASQNLDGLEVIVADISDEGGRQELFTNWLGKRQKCLYRHLPRCAAGAAKNYLLETAAGEYIAFLGEDICYLPGGLEKLYAQAKESGADMVIGRAAGGSFGGKEYPAAWTVDGALVPQKEPFAAEDIGERALLLCKGWSGDKLFRSAYLRESGLRFGEGAFSSVPFVFGTLVCGKSAVSKEPVLYTQDVECVKYRRSPKKSASDIQAAMLALEAMLKKKKPFSDSFAAEQALACELERKIRSKLKEVAFLAMPQNAYGFQNDKINAHPLHYCRTVNEYKMQALKKIVFEHASNGQIQQLCDEYDKKLEQELNSLQPVEPAGGGQ